MLVFTKNSLFGNKNKNMRILMKRAAFIVCFYSVYNIFEFTIQSWISVEMLKEMFDAILVNNKILQ